MFIKLDREIRLEFDRHKISYPHPVFRHNRPYNISKKKESQRRNYRVKITRARFDLISNNINDIFEKKRSNKRKRRRDEYKNAHENIPSRKTFRKLKYFYNIFHTTYNCNMPHCIG